MRERVGRLGDRRELIARDLRRRPQRDVVRRGRRGLQDGQLLGAKVLQRTAWKVADQLGWETTCDAEFVALTQLQADIFVTSGRELARAVSGIVETAPIDALRAS